MADNVKNPSYYNRGKIEVWEFIEDQDLDYYTGNAIKYIARAGFKDPSKEVEDLQKAIAFLERKIKVLEKDKDGQVEEKTKHQPFEDSITEDNTRYLEWRYMERLITLTEYIDKYDEERSFENKTNCIIAYFVAKEYMQLLPSSLYSDLFQGIEGVMEKMKLFK